MALGHLANLNNRDAGGTVPSRIFAMRINIDHRAWSMNAKALTCNSDNAIRNVVVHPLTRPTDPRGRHPNVSLSSKPPGSLQGAWRAVRRWLRLCLTVLFVLQGGAVLADDAVITQEAIQARIEEVDKAPTLTDEMKSTIRDLYRKARVELKSAATDAARAEASADAARTAPEDLGRARRELSLIPYEPLVDVSAEESLDRLQERLEEREAELAAQSAELERLNGEPKRRATRRRDITKQRVILRKRANEIQRQLEAEPDADDPPELALAKRSYLEAKAQALQATLASGINELDSYQATLDLLPLQRDLAAARVAQLQRDVKKLDSALKRRRRGEVAAHLQKAHADATSFADSQRLAQQAEVNLTLVRRRKELRDQIEKVTQDLTAVSEIAAGLEQQRTRVEHKVTSVGLTGAIGLLMRKHKSLLPEVDRYSRDVRLRQPKLKSAQLTALELEDRRADLTQLDAELARLAAAAESAGQSPLTSRELDDLRKLLINERRYTDFLISDSNYYVEQLLNLDESQRQLITATEDFTQFIDEHVLWVRSAETLSVAELPVAVSALGQFFGSGQFTHIAAALRADFRNHPFWYCVILATLLLARIAGWQMTLQYTRPRAGSMRPTRFGRLVHDSVRVVLCAAPLPVLLWFVGQRLSGLPAETGFGRAVGIGLITVSMTFLPLAILFRMCRPRGFARRHLGWSDKGIRQLRSMLVLLMLVIMPLLFVHATLNAQDNVRWQDSLGRICFVINVLIVALFAERLLRPRSGVLYRMLRPSPDDILARLRWLWYLAGVGVHIALAIIAVVGYTYAADRLGQHVRATELLLTGLFLIGSLLVHWAHVNSRRLAIRRVSQLREAEAAAIAAAETAAGVEATSAAAFAEMPKGTHPDAGDGWFIEPEPTDNNMRSLVTTMLILVGVIGSWFIWVDIIPAFNIVSKYKLWDTEVAVSQAVPQGEGDSQSTAVYQVTELIPVTLGDVLLAAFFVAGTIIAARHIAGLFELPVLDRMPLDSALRNSITTVTRYVLWIVAVIVAAGLLGISWAKVQWMAAALSLGLGFGLQEIFANFIAGLIILFERPMRVGDIITIGDTTGVVQGIRMRATTITDWDRKELVVPNKEFATGRLLNWTLTNRTNRRVIEVGVEYGTDPDLVRDLLLKVAHENERVLETPKPVALFQKYADSSLIFSLRVYYAKISDRLRGLHELNTAIQKEFDAAGVKFAFPRRDLQIRSPQPPISWFGPEEENDPDR